MRKEINPEMSFIGTLGVATAPLSAQRRHSSNPAWGRTEISGAGGESLVKSIPALDTKTNSTTEAQKVHQQADNDLNESAT